MSQIRFPGSQSASLAPTLAGYRMGGAGVYHLLAHDAETFDVAVPVAGYVVGTLDTDDPYHAPQPESSDAFWKFLGEYASRIAHVPVLIALHAAGDMDSSYRDTVSIIASICTHGGNAKLVTVPDRSADSNSSVNKKKKNRCGEQYFHFSLLDDTSEQVLYADLRSELSAIKPRTARVSQREQRGHKRDAGSGGSASKKATRKGHPGCRSVEDCDGQASEDLLIHVMGDGSWGDVYCRSCWHFFGDIFPTRRLS